MKLLRHPIAGLVLFAVLVALCVGIYNGIESGYKDIGSFERTDNKTISGTTGNMMDHLGKLTIITSLNQTTSSIYDLKSPTANPLDIVGSLASAAIGVLGLIAGLLIFPFQIVSIILVYYGIPAIIVNGFLLFIVIYVGFIILSAYLRSDL